MLDVVADGVTRIGPEFDVKLFGKGLVDVDSVCSSTFWEASAMLSLTGDIPLCARSGDISIALNVALSCETNWLWARDRRDLFAKMLELRDGLGRAVLFLHRSCWYLDIRGPDENGVLVGGGSGTVIGGSS